MKTRLSINHFQGKLNLPRGSRGLADNAKSTSVHNVRWQPEVHDVEDIEELGAKLQRAEFRVATVPEGSVFNHREIEAVKRGTTKRVSTQSAEASTMRAGPFWNRNLGSTNRYEEE